jgi:hypothetical protein
MKVLRKSGKYLKNQINAYLTILVICTITAAILLLTAIQQSPIYINPNKYTFSAEETLIVIIALGLLARRKCLNHKSGLEGETTVSNHLESRLSDDYSIINDLKGKNGNVDHVILSPYKIFVLETKNNVGEVVFTGSNWSYGWSPVYQVNGNAAYVHDLLQGSGVLLSRTVPWLTGVVVFPKAKLAFRSGSPSSPVKVLVDLPEFIKSFEGGRREYSEEELDKIENFLIKVAGEGDSLERSFASVLWKDIKEFF